MRLKIEELIVQARASMAQIKHKKDVLIGSCGKIQLPDLPGHYLVVHVLERSGFEYLLCDIVYGVNAVSKIDLNNTDSATNIDEMLEFVDDYQKTYQDRSPRLKQEDIVRVVREVARKKEIVKKLMSQDTERLEQVKTEVEKIVYKNSYSLTNPDIILNSVRDDANRQRLIGRLHLEKQLKDEVRKLALGIDE